MTAVISSQWAYSGPGKTGNALKNTCWVCNNTLNAWDDLLLSNEVDKISEQSLGIFLPDGSVCIQLPDEAPGGEYFVGGTSVTLSKTAVCIRTQDTENTAVLGRRYRQVTSRKEMEGLLGKAVESFGAVFGSIEKLFTQVKGWEE